MARPMEPPTWRNSELRPVASAILWRGIAVRATVESGTKRQEKPMPCVMIARMTSLWPLCEREVAHVPGAPGDEEDADGDDDPRRDAVVDAPDERRRDHHHEDARHHREARVGRREAEQLLHEERQQEHRRHEQREHERADERPREEHRILEEADVDRRNLARELADDERGDERERGPEGDGDGRRLEPVVLLPLLEEVLQRAEARDEQADAPPVDVACAAPRRARGSSRRSPRPRGRRRQTIPRPRMPTGTLM